ncbi:MAG: site-specific integrase [Candidatus Eremiobacteraeota bacterium]|nr:site-specific integrase [Candidatus Eremiobacteraeota bacterium]
MAKARRGRGEGAVYYVKARGRWCASVSFGADPQTGKRVRRTLYGRSKHEVQQRLNDLQNRTGAELTNRRSPTLREFIKGWLEREVKPNQRATTYRSYEGIARLHVLPFIGSVRVNKATPSDIERCVAIVRELTGASMAGKTRTLLHGVFERAVALDITARNPVAKVKAPKYEKAPMQFLDAEQVRALLDAARGDRLEALAVVLVTAGLRVGEALALRWCDVDTTQRTIRVERTAQESIGAIVFTAPKTKAGTRRVALGALTVGALRRRRTLAEREGFATPDDLVFPTLAGTAQRKSNLHRRWWHPLLEKAALPRIRLHDLRHSAASLSLAAGTNARVVSERLGHADPSLTQRVYQHTVDSLHRADAEAVDTLLQGEKRPD